MPVVRHAAAVVAAAILVALVIVPGCGGATVESVCAKCSSTTNDSCVKDGNAQQALAASKGCDAEFQAQLDCLADNGKCSASGEIEPVTACEKAISDYVKCTGQQLG